MLSPYRVIDLADDRGIFCGRVLADLGAEVIKIEPPAGDPARRVGPFYKDEPGIENSLYWQLYAANKKSAALDIEATAGRAALLRLVATADFLVESFRPGYLDAIGLGFDHLRRLNPRLVYVSITPFGQDGPYRDFLATDLTGSALSGFAYLTGDADRPPLRVSVPQFWTLGAAAGAAGAMVAHADRLRTGRGQRVDVSCQQALTRTLSHAPQFWDMNQIILQRSGPFRPIGNGRALRVNFECADGYVNYIQPGGATGGRAMASLSAWMDEEGEGHPLLRDTDFGAYGFGQLPDEVLDAMSVTLEAFFKPRTKRYLSEQAIARRVLLFPVNDPADICSYPQLAARGFFRETEAPDGGALTNLGPWIRSSERPIEVRRAPRLGEHTDEALAAAGLPPPAPADVAERNSRPASVRSSRMSGPFEGLRVLDFCWVVIGPMTTRYFSDFGATVLRVESSLRPDVIRHGLPFAEGKPGLNRSGYWANYNSGKLGLGLNMADERARKLAFRLATEWADVVTENFTPGTMEKWGLGYDEIRKGNPGVVMFSASMLGRGGPHDSQPGFGPVLTALSGHTNFTGWPDRVPVSPYGAYTDFLIPHIAFSAVAAALDHKRRTGRGQHLDLSQLEAALYFAGPPILDYTANQRVQQRDGNRDSTMAPHAIYRCAGNDRWCAVACENDAQWQALAGLIGRPALGADPKFARFEGRKAREAELDDAIGSWTSALSPDEVMRRCQAAGVPAGAVRDSRDLFTDPQHQSRGHFVFMDHPDMGRYASDANCFALSDASPEYRPSPLLGEHTEQIMREILGIPPDEYRALADEGVFE